MPKAERRQAPEMVSAPRVKKDTLFGAPRTKATIQDSVPQDTLEVGKSRELPKDYNYSFFPADQYTQRGRFHYIDSIEKQVKIRYDSAAAKIQVSVKKEYDQIQVSGAFDPSQIYYKQAVQFIGFTADGTYTMVYQAKTKEQEIVFVNPFWGFFIVGFKTCKKEWGTKESDCDFNFHYFGRVAPGKYMPPKE